MLYWHLYCKSKYFFNSSEAYLEPCQITMKEIFRENSKELEAVNYFRQKTSLYMFERVLITPN